MGDNPCDFDRGHLNAQVEHDYEPDRQAMLAALRVVLGLPRVIPSTGSDDLQPYAD